MKALHVYDFDNTLFSSPLPNPQLWSGPTIGLLQAYEGFAGGGWWHDPVILEATGGGVEIEQTRAWQGWWNEEVVKLVQASMAQKDALTILLTGRGETRFADLVQKIVETRNLDFDLVCLKPEVGPQQQTFASTINYKQEFLRDLVCTYKQADEIRIYEDRPKHVKGFREYFEKFNKSLLSHRQDEPAPPRSPITAEVVPVAELNSYLDAVIEVSMVQTLINKHNTVVTEGGLNSTRSRNPNLYLKKQFVYFGYLINPRDSQRLVSLANVTPQSIIDNGDVRFMGSSICISPRPANTNILQKVGGVGKKVMWQITGTAVLDSRIWAARVAPVSASEQYHVDAPTPIVVLALRKGARPIDANRITNWQPVPAEKQYVFESVVGDKAFLSIEKGDDNNDPGYRNGTYSRQNSGSTKRKYHENGYRGKENAITNGYDMRNDDFPPLPGPGQQRNNNGGGDRHGQGRYFQQQLDGPGGDRRNFSANNRNQNFSNRGGKRGRETFNNKNNPNINPDAPPLNPRMRDQTSGRQGQAGNRRGGQRGGPPGYRSLDDYGNDSSLEQRSGNAAGPNDAVMNY